MQLFIGQVFSANVSFNSEYTFQTWNFLLIKLNTFKSSILTVNSVKICKNIVVNFGKFIHFSTTSFFETKIDFPVENGLV